MKLELNRKLLDCLDRAEEICAAYQGNVENGFVNLLRDFSVEIREQIKGRKICPLCKGMGEVKA